MVTPHPHGGALGELWKMSFLLSVHLKGSEQQCGSFSPESNGPDQDDFALDAQNF